MVSGEPRDLGWSRRLVLAVLPLIVGAVLPWLLLAAVGDRLPARALVGRWSRIAPEYWGLAPTWSHWAWGYVVCLVVALLLGAAFFPYRNWARAQRVLVLVGWLFAGYALAGAALDVWLLLDAHEPVVPQQPWWSGVARLVAVPVGGVVGRLLAGPLPAAQRRGTTPPRAAERLRLEPQERAVFAATATATPHLIVGVLLIAVGVWRLWAGGVEEPGGFFGCALGLLLVAHFRARLRIDDSGAWLTLPLLGGVWRHVPLDDTEYADVRMERARWSGIVGGRTSWGYAGRGGSAVVLHLTDGSEFLFTVGPEQRAHTAAGLVNSLLDRRANAQAGSGPTANGRNEE